MTIRLGVIILLLLIIAGIVIISYITIKEKYLSYVNLTPIFFDDIIPKRTVNVPLTELTSPLHKVYTDIDPRDIEFAMYKTKYLTPVRDQGDDCGSCWAFATCDVISDRLSVITNGFVNKPLSVQQLLSCVYDEKRNGCQGGDPEKAFDWIAKTGYHLLPVGSEQDTKYIQSNQYNPYIIGTPCIQSSEGVTIDPNSIRSLTKFINKENIHRSDPEYNQLQENIYNMKAELLNGGPFYCALTVYEDFYTYGGTHVYESSNRKLIGGHAIEIIGYCDKDVDTRPGFDKPYWICRNAWGSNWPIESEDKGFFAILMGNNECGVESRCGMANPLIRDNYNTDRRKTMFTNYQTFRNSIIKGSFITE